MKFVTPLLLVLALFSACATPGLPPQLALGMTPEQVFLKMGKPERRYLRKTADGTSEVWAWIMTDAREPHEPANYHPSYDAFPPPYWYYGVERVRVMFKDGKVASIEAIRKWQ